MHDPVRHGGIGVPVGLVLFFEFAALILREYARQELLRAGTDARSAAHLSAIAGFLVFALFMAPLWRRLAPALVRGWRRPGAWAGLIAASVATGIVMRLASRCLALARLYLATGGPGGDGPSAPIVHWQCPPAGYVLLSVAVLAIATPLVEETVSRGLILAELRARRVPFAIAISAGAFAVFHDPGTIPMAFLFGIVAAHLAIRQGTLWGAFFAHATFNALVLVDSDCLRLAAGPAPSVPAGLLLIGTTVGLVLLAVRIANAGGAGPAGPGRSCRTSP